MKRLIHIALSVLLLSLPLKAEADGVSAVDSLLSRYKTFSSWCAPEKVYLHYDRSCYTAGETLWFKGWVQEASRYSVLPPSNFLYAELLDGNGEAVSRVKIKRDGNGFPGCIPLPENLETGDYTLRAYTLWQLNYDSAFLFNDRIRIIGGTPRPEQSREVPPPDVDISFWPEGGRYFAGCKSVIGFKVVDMLGKSVDFSGHLVSDAGVVEGYVFTRHDGMGAVSFTPKVGSTYSIRDAQGKLHPLPAPSQDGATLHLRIRSGRYYVSTLGFGGGAASLLLRDATELRHVAGVNLDGKMSTLMIEQALLRPGINHFLLVDSRGKILSERLFFVRDPEAPLCRLGMKVFPSAPRALVRGVISLSRPDGSPLDGDCSVSVVRGSLKDWQQSDGMVSYMGLSSELRGNINRPYDYFNPEIPLQERDDALDLLMMIQGWRYYDLEKITDRKGGRFVIRYMRERLQEIRGRISRRLSSKIPRKFTFTFFIPKKNLVHSVDVEQGRDFVIDSLDFPENTEFLISIGTERLWTEYLPKWNGDPAAEPFLYQPAPGYTRDVRMAAPLFHETASLDTLQAAVVTATYKEDDVLVFGRSYREDLLTYKEMTLVEYLSMKNAGFEYDGEYMYNRNRRRRSASSGMDESDDSFGKEAFEEEDESGRVKLIVEETDEAWWGFDMLRLEDLRSLSISTRPDPVYGGDGGVVHISVKPGGIQRNREERDPSLLYFVPLGYQLPRYFESPRYDGGEKGSFDARNTLWWSPDVQLKEGSAMIEFCNSDQMDYPYIVRIEGLGADGRPFSCHCSVAPGE